jgi:hypothetical protein
MGDMNSQEVESANILITQKENFIDLVSKVEKEIILA